MTVDVRPVSAIDPQVVTLVDALTRELAGGGYTQEQTFGYSIEQLAASGVHLVGAFVGDELAGIGGVELQDDATAELKRFFVRPEHRGAGVADAIITALLAVAGTRAVRLETGDRQLAAMRFYARHGFVRVGRFAPYLDSVTSVCMERALP